MERSNSRVLIKPQQKENSKQIHRIAVTCKAAVAYIKHTSSASVLIYILYVMRCFAFYILLEYWKLFNFQCLTFNFICSIPCTVIYLLNKTNKMHIYCIFFPFMHLNVSVYMTILRVLVEYISAVMCEVQYIYIFTI